MKNNQQNKTNNKMSNKMSKEKNCGSKGCSSKNKVDNNENKN
jgi:hypothetical protein